MSSIQDIAEGLAATIGDATGLRNFPYVPDNVNPPVMVLVLGTIERGAMSRGQMQIPFEAWVLTQRVSDRAGQQSLYEYASFTSPKSVWKAVDDTKSLGLPDTDAAVLRYRPLGMEEVAAIGYFGGAFEILVLTDGSD
jgi:hypothetical protein